MPTPFIDVWANYWHSGFFTENSLHRDLYRRLGLVKRAALSDDDIASEYRSAGAHKVLMSATIGQSASVSNDEVANFVQANSDIFVGCASVDPRHVSLACRELERAVSQLYFCAVKLMPYLYGLPANAPLYYPIYAKAIELQIPVLILTGHTAVKQRSVLGHPGALDDVALDFPELIIVAGHAGVPWTDELISLAWKHENLFIETSGHLPRHYPPNLVKYLNSYGRGKVCFGTGFPLFSPASLVGELSSMDLAAASKHELLCGVASRIWGWEAAITPEQSS